MSKESQTLAFSFFSTVCFAYLQFLHTLTSQKFTITSQYAMYKAKIQTFWLSWLQEKLTRKKMLKKKQSDIHRRQAGTHSQTARMDNLWQGLSYTMEITAKTLGLQADETLVIIQCTVKKIS